MSFLFSFDSLDEDLQPKILVVRQPSTIYRMRYQKDSRQTNLFADSEQKSDLDSDQEDSDDEMDSGEKATRSRKQSPKVKVKLRKT